MEWFFTADEHYFHENIIKFTNRPYANIREMNEALISNHNEIVSKGDITVHAGDFALTNPRLTVDILGQLNGNHILLMGSHDRAIERIVKKGNYAEKEYHDGLFTYRGRILEMAVKNRPIVVCHYCIRVWAKSHYNAWHLYGHSHGQLEPIGKSWDIGVDNNNFYPLSFENVCEIMTKRPDNPNLVPRPRPAK